MRWVRELRLVVAGRESGRNRAGFGGSRRGCRADGDVVRLAGAPGAVRRPVGLNATGLSDRSTHLKRARRWAGVSAIGAAALFTVVNLLWVFQQPSQGASAPEIVNFYSG